MFAPLASAAEVRAAEEAYAGSLDELMERAGTAVAQVVIGRFPGSVAVVCGHGKNGGDGKVCSRVLEAAGRDVTVVEGFGEIGEPDVIVDALFGIGLKDAPREDAARMIERINATGKPVVAVDIASGVERVRRLLSGMHGCHFEPGAIFAERFLPGREFTVLVVDGPEGVLAFPGERQFHPGLAAHDRILTFERHSGDFVDDAPPPDDQPSFTYVAVDDGTAASLSALAIAAYAAVDGNGYARVDLKEGVGGAVMVLEVNANCGLGPGALSSAGQLLGLAGRDMMYLLPLLLDHAGHRNQGIS